MGDDESGSPCDLTSRRRTKSHGIKVAVYLHLAEGKEAFGIEQRRSRKKCVAPLFFWRRATEQKISFSLLLRREIKGGRGTKPRHEKEGIGYRRPSSLQGYSS